MPKYTMLSQMEMQPVVVQAYFSQDESKFGFGEKCIGKFRLNCSHFFRCVEIVNLGMGKMGLPYSVLFNAAVSC